MKLQNQLQSVNDLSNQVRNLQSRITELKSEVTVMKAELTAKSDWNNTLSPKQKTVVAEVHGNCSGKQDIKRVLSKTKDEEIVQCGKDGGKNNPPFHLASSEHRDILRGRNQMSRNETILGNSKEKLCIESEYDTKVIPQV